MLVANSVSLLNDIVAPFVANAIVTYDSFHSNFIPWIVYVCLPSFIGFEIETWCKKNILAQTSVINYTFLEFYGRQAKKGNSNTKHPYLVFYELGWFIVFIFSLSYVKPFCFWYISLSLSLSLSLKKITKIICMSTKVLVKCKR